MNPISHPRPHLFGLLAGLALAAGLAFAAVVLASAWTRIAESQVINVTGSARKNVRSDLVVWRASFSVDAPTLIEAQSKLRADHAKVAMTPEGRFDIAYEHAFSPGFNDIILKQFTASGALSWTREVANSQSDETAPSVSMDNSGKAVVVWQNAVGSGSEVRFSRADASGNLGHELIVENALFSESNPSVALKRNGGGTFVVTYERKFRTFPFPSVTRVRVAEVSASDQVTIVDAGVRSKPAVSINGAGKYLVTYTSNDSSGLNVRNRFGTL